MSQDWCTIESDPGVFTELINNIGVKNVQVDEILDLEMLNPDSNVYGVIFLFKYISKSNYKPNVLTNYDESLYFAKQVIVNACATQAILAILLNNDDLIDIGETLKELKVFSTGMDPTLKGVCFSNCEKVKLEHNKFAK
jgi:ubiquitin carboxyl-terminal hydrolase L5